MKEEMKKIVLFDTYANEKVYLLVTNSQWEILKWLKQNEWLAEDVDIEEYDENKVFQHI